MSKKYKCIVNRIEYTEGSSMIEVISGIKQYEQCKYDGKYKGGNGTYVDGFTNYPSELKAKIYICELSKYCYLDIKEYVLDINSRSRISKKMVEKLNELNSGKKIYFEFEYGDIKNDLNNLRKLNLKL